MTAQGKKIQIGLCFRMDELQLPKEKVGEKPYIGKVQEQSSLYCGTIRLAQTRRLQP